MRSWFTVALVVLQPLTLAAAEVSVQEALLRAKPAVVLVIVEVGSEVTLSCRGREEKLVRPAAFRETGTGWFLSPRGWMITNASIVSAAQAPPARVADQQVRRAVREACGELPPETLAAIARRARVKLNPSISVILPNGTRLTPTVSKVSPPLSGTSMSGRDLALLKLEADDLPTLGLGDSSNAQIGDRLHILGFPGVVLTHELLNASAKVEASVTSGAISGFKQDVTNQPVIQTDAPAAWGASGGPAVNSRGEVVGVLTFVSADGGDEGSLVQGFNFVIPSTAVRDFLTGTGVPLDQPSRFNAAWHAGLHAYFAGDYARAASHFAEANRLVLDLPDVRRMTAEAKNPPPKPFPWESVLVVVTVLSVGGYAALWGLRWRRNRYRIRPAEVMRLLEASPERPIILDVRDAATYAKSPVRIPDSTHLTQQELETGVTTLRIEPTRTVVAYCT